MLVCSLVNSVLKRSANEKLSCRETGANSILRTEGKNKKTIGGKKRWQSLSNESNYTASVTTPI